MSKIIQTVFQTLLHRKIDSGICRFFVESRNKFIQFHPTSKRGMAQYIFCCILFFQETDKWWVTSDKSHCKIQQPMKNTARSIFARFADSWLSPALIFCDWFILRIILSEIAAGLFFDSACFSLEVCFNPLSKSIWLVLTPVYLLKLDRFKCFFFFR